MTTKCIVFNRADGGITIRNPALAERKTGESEVDFLARIADAHPVKTGEIARTVIEKASAPTDYSYRDAWTFGAQKFGVDMPKAREIQRDRLRRDRAPLMAALDVEWSRAMAKGDATVAQEVEAKRQALRDLPANPAIDAALTPDALKLIKAN